MAGWLWGLIVVLALYAAQLAAVLTMEYRRQAHLTAWILICMACPFAGFAAYLLIGRRKPEHVIRSTEIQSASKRIEPTPAGPTTGHEERPISQMEKSLGALADYPVTRHNRTKILTNGEATFEAILHAMASARDHIHLDYYTIRNDGIGRRFLDILTEKARKGIEVRVVYDGIGSLKLDEGYLRTLDEAGVAHACFAPPRWAFLERKMNYRNHRKIAVIDGRIGFIGGINIGDEYIGLDPKLGFWRDTHIQVQGDAVHYLQETFMRDWLLAKGERLERLDRYMPVTSIKDEERVIIVPGEPGSNEQEIVGALFAAMASAQSRIYAATPYFIPDPAIAMSLRIAAGRGLDVRLIIPGIADSKLVLLSSLSYVHDMLEAGVRIFRYQKGFIHSKVLIVDNELASVGTANLDMRSLYSNYELLALLFGEKPIRRLERDFLDDLAHSKEIELRSFVQRPARQKAAEAIMHILSPLL
ncbi:cardiolipin synthase [Paenibacillus sp. 1011MAR3C5]|uniref:cardiolipin synthase n=1 Tax=Paenibacillus sp. 1011MAR3C5 TaxID=1675787 RepID=UPI000E6C4666|nr:cardiolipin synthase [Paenibacillus sp. 1011MAR3C5]RJE88869.1 cardiolipin synthase [Paenibacillus sp. 1011MAR3C5]